LEINDRHPVSGLSASRNPQRCLIDLLPKVDGGTGGIQHHHQTERRISRFKVHDGTLHAIFKYSKIVLREICHPAPLIDDADVELNQRGARGDYIVRRLRV
jgi:hypothetical protein